MKTTLLKKFVGLTSIFSILFCNLISTNVLAETNCPDLNDKGGILDLHCALDLGKELIIEGKKSYIKMDNIGGNSEYTLHFFAPKEISQVLNKFEAPMDIDTFNQQEEAIKLAQRENTNKTIEKISTVKNSISSFLSILGFGCASYVTIDTLNQKNNQTKNKNDKKAVNKNKEKNKSNIKFSFRSLIAWAALGSIALLNGVVNLAGILASSIVRNKSENDIEKHYRDRLESSIIEKHNYFSALEGIASKIKFNLLNVDNFLCIKLNKHPDDYMAEVFSFDNGNAAYTESEKIKFNEDLKTLKKDIKEILENK